MHPIRCLLSHFPKTSGNGERISRCYNGEYSQLPDSPYSRQEAAYPLLWLRERKFWPTVSRVDDGELTIGYNLVVFHLSINMFQRMAILISL